MGVVDSIYIIKNCPFCDGQGKLHKMAGNAFFVACSNPACKAEQIIFGSEKAAVQRWNKRPTTPERPKGEWIWKERIKGGFTTYTGDDTETGEKRTIVCDERRKVKLNFCSICGKVGDDTWLKFCPNCGADMRREEQNT